MLPHILKHRGGEHSAPFCFFLCVGFALLGRGQSLQGTLSARAYEGSGTLSNCTGTPPNGCQTATLASGVNTILLSGSQIVLGPGFTASAVGTSSTLTAFIGPALSFTTYLLPQGYINSPYSAVIGATGGFAPYYFGWASNAPPGIQLSSGGLMTGTGSGGTVPPPQGSYNGVGIVAYDSTGASVTTYFSLTINGPSSGPLVTCSASPSPANMSQSVTFTATASGGSGSYFYSWLGPASGTGSTASFVPSAGGNVSESVAVTDTVIGSTTTAACEVAILGPNGSEPPITVNSDVPDARPHRPPAPTPLRLTRSPASAGRCLLRLPGFRLGPPIPSARRSVRLAPPRFRLRQARTRLPEPSRSRSMHMGPPGASQRT